MSAQELRDSLRVLDPEQQRMVLALGIVLDRIRRLTPEDSEDLFELLREYTNTDSDEAREAADAAMMEILEQESVKVKLMDLVPEASPSPKMEKWLDWVSRRIHDLRETAGVTQDELAERTGLPQSHISRLENGKHSPSRYTLEKIAQALDVEVSEFDPSAD